MRGGAVWQLVGLITRRSQVQILPPLPIRIPQQYCVLFLAGFGLAGRPPQLKRLAFGRFVLSRYQLSLFQASLALFSRRHCQESPEGILIN